MEKSSEENIVISELVREARSKLYDDSERAKLLLKINNAVVSNLDLRELLKTVSTCLKQVVSQQCPRAGKFYRKSRHSDFRQRASTSPL